MEAIRIIVLAAASSMTLVMMLMMIISSASAELTEEAPSPSSSTTTAAAAVSVPLQRSRWLFTMQFSIGNTKVSGIADTGSEVIWTNNSRWLLDPVMSCGGIASPSCGGLCTFERKYGDGDGTVRGVKGKAKLTFGGGDGSAAAPAPASSSGVVVDSPDLTIGSALMFDDCDQHHHLSSSSDDGLLTDENRACRAYAAGGIVGLNRDELSLVRQLKLHNFSYCLPHLRHGSTATAAAQIKFNDAAAITSIAGTSTTTSLLVEGITSPRHYVVKVKNIQIGKTSPKDVREAPDDCCSLNKDQRRSSSADTGAGVDMIIDSGTALTWLPEDCFDCINKKVKKLLDEEKKGEVREHKKGYSCYQGTYPERMESIVLNFASGGGMEIPPENYFFQEKKKTTDGGGEDSYFCLALNNNKESKSIVLGAYQQQDMHMLFDVKEEKKNTLSFVKHIACGGGGKPPAQDQENHATM